MFYAFETNCGIICRNVVSQLEFFELIRKDSTKSLYLFKSSTNLEIIDIFSKRSIYLCENETKKENDYVFSDIDVDSESQKLCSVSQNGVVYLFSYSE